MLIEVRFRMSLKVSALVLDAEDMFLGNIPGSHVQYLEFVFGKKIISIGAFSELVQAGRGRPIGRSQTYRFGNHQMQQFF